MKAQKRSDVNRNMTEGKDAERGSFGDERSGRPAEKYKELMIKLVPLVDIAFSKKVVGRCLGCTTVNEILSKIKDGVLDSSGFIDFLKIIFFSIKRGETKTKNDTTRAACSQVQNEGDERCVETPRKIRSSSFALTREPHRMTNGLRNQNG